MKSLNYSTGSTAIPSMDSIRRKLAAVHPLKLNREDLRAAAVMVLISMDPEPALMLTVRSIYLTRHSGEISFPGGVTDLTDSCLQDTALRELHEETNIHRENVEIIGRMDEVQTMTGYCITPFAGFLHSPFQAVPDGSEIEEIFFVPLSFFLQTPRIQYRTIYFRKTVRTFRYFQYQHRAIWGATARITEKLIAILQHPGESIMETPYITENSDKSD